VKKIYIIVLLLISMQSLHSQSWNITGNSGISTSNFLGTTDSKDLIFKVNNTERGRLSAANNVWRFGSAINFVKIDTAGKLTFGGNGAYKVAGNKYVFQYTGNPNQGLFFNSTSVQYEFRNGSAVPVFTVNANTGNSVFNGTVEIGAYTLPSTDGTTGQVLTTNGSGAVSWSNASGSSGADSSLSNLAAPTAINAALLPGTDNSISLGSSVKGWANIYIDSALYIGGTKFLTGNSSSGNTGVGLNALSANAGFENVATGAYTLFSNTTGTYNTANGEGALFSNTTGSENTANGGEALYYNTTGSYNTANGVNALNFNTGGGNTANGANALFSNTTGYNNTANGHYALFSNTIGSENVANGYHALYSNNTGSENMALGDFSDVPYYSDLNNATVIGYDALVSASNSVRIGNASVTSIGGQVGWTTFSDGRYKKNIKEDVQGLKFINLLKPITYTVDINGLNTHYDNLRKKDSAYDKAKAQMQSSAEAAAKIIYNGFIAQDVEKAAQSINYNFSGVDKPQNKDGLYGLRYADFVVPLVKAVQELSKMNDSKDAKIDSLQNQLNDLKTLVLQIQQQQQSCACSASVNSGAVEQYNVALSNAASLEQNIPNPFTNTTTIGYTLPQKFSSAQIIIADKNGKVLKQLSLSGAGKGSVHVDAAMLASGAYNYALYVDGKMIDSKQMVSAK
jgi:hypothetical protein